MKCYMGIEIEEKVAKRGLTGLGCHIANLVILNNHIYYDPTIVLLSIYI